MSCHHPTLQRNDDGVCCDCGAFIHEDLLRAMRQAALDHGWVLSYRETEEVAKAALAYLSGTDVNAPLIAQAHAMRAALKAFVTDPTGAAYRLNEMRARALLATIDGSQS